MRLPDPGRSRALVLGCSSYDDPLLPDLPAVAGNRTGMQQVLTSPEGTGLALEHCVVLEEAEHVPAEIGSRLTALVGEAEDMLLVYYAGHGLIGRNGELFLALPRTRSDGGMVSWTALQFDLLRSTLAGARARNRILILDCCFSGLAIDTMAGVASTVSGQLAVAGTCTLASSPANRPYSVPRGSDYTAHTSYTAYTGEFLHLLRNGSADLPELLTVTAIHEHLVRALSGRGLPVPVQRNTETIGNLALAPNKQWVLPAGRPRPGTPQPPPLRQPLTAPAPARIGGSTSPAVRLRAAAGRGASPVVLAIVAGAVIAALASSALVAYWPVSTPRPSSSATIVAGKHPPASASPPAHAATSTVTIGVGKAPYAVAVDPATNTAYVTNFGGNSVSVIDTATNTVTATIEVGNSPQGVAVDPAAHAAYVTNLVGQSVSVIDTATNTVTATISVGLSPQDVAVDPATNTAYVASTGVFGSVSVIDTATDTVTGTISVRDISYGVAVDPATNTAYVANSGGNSVSVIDTATNTVTATIKVGNTPRGVAVDLATGTAYVANSNSNSVSVIKTR